jgi:methionyl-tRNA synthetase
MAEKFMITAALPYANGNLHVGHIAGAYLPADIFVRYQRSLGNDVMFVCGSDDNGVPITLTARKENTTPADVVARYNAAQKQAFDGLGIAFDIYGGTHSPADNELHTQFSQHFFKTALERGFLSKRKSTQLYDPQAKMFLPDRYVKGTCHHCKAAEALGDQCEACGKTIDPMMLINPISVISGAKPEPRETTHWFFELEKFRASLKEWLDSRVDWRASVLNFSKGLLEQELPARSITRDLDWGVPVPLDEPEAAGKVLYVWFDAPIGYVSFTARACQQKFGDWQQYQQWWKSPDCKVLHFIGEDNNVFHAIIWPAMLMAEGSYQLPTQVVSNCFLNFRFPGKEEEEKMSKSRGTAVWIHEYLKDFDPDPLRYYLTAIAPETQRAAFSFEDLVQRNNDELVAALGNLFHRTLTFAHKYFEGKLPAVAELADVDRQQLASLPEIPTRVGALIGKYAFKSALNELMSAARAANKYFDTKQPWSTRKTNMADCGTTIHVCLQTLRTLTTTMAPFLPFAAEKAATMLGLDAEAMRWNNAATLLPTGRSLGEAAILFKKLELDDVASAQAKKA